MGRKKDPIWNHVEKLNEKVFKCNYCGEEFAGGASRIKAHLLGIEGKGIRKCVRVPCSSVNTVNPQQDFVNSSKGVEGAGVVIQTDVPEECILFPELLQWVTVPKTNDSNQHNLKKVNSTAAEVNCFNSNQSAAGNVNSGDPKENYLISNQSITRNINSNGMSKGKSIMGWKNGGFLQNVESRLNGGVKNKLCEHVDIPQTEKMDVDICSDASDNVQKVAYDASNKRLKKNIHSSHHEDNFINSNSLNSSSKGNAELYPMPVSADFIGEVFESYIDKIWGWLMNEEESLIGVCGMGGVGKSILLKHIYNKLLDASYHVIWVDVPQNCSVFRLQKALADSCNLYLLDMDGTVNIAAKLLHAFKKLKKCVIILNDVWVDIDLESVGIPLINSELQVIISSRLFDVCQIMGCKKQILRIVPLSQDGRDSWHLFLKVLGEDESRLSDEVTDIARSVVYACDGLPLAIATLAKSMRGKEDIREWEYIENLIFSAKAQEDMKKSVFPLLALSYNHLNDKCLQECFLCCAFTLEYNNFWSRQEDLIRMNSLIRREDLIIHLVNEGLINRKKNLEAELDEGHIILNKLINNNMLIEDDKRDVYIHSLVWDMAANIAEVDKVYMVKNREDLRALENLRKVRLSIEEIPSGISPKCPRLSSLNLSNYNLELIPDNFFINMPSLKVLNLSHCRRIQHLPASISSLVSLTALLLDNCSSLESVPSLAKLQKLERLDLFGTRITELPLGLEMLINFRWLDLRRTGKLMMSSASVIPKLTTLQVLLLDQPMNVKAADLGVLRLLERISVKFSDENEFNGCVRRVVNAQNRGLKNYHLSLEREPEDWGSNLTAVIYGSNKAIITFVGIENAASLLLPVHMNKLIIKRCHEWRSLCDVLSFDDTNNARRPKHWSCKIDYCAKLENVFCQSSFCSFCSSIQSLQSLSLKILGSLRMLCKETNVAATATWSPFSSLRCLTVSACDLLETLLTPGMIGHLQNLETLDVSYCNAMEEIFSSEKNNECTDVDIDHSHRTLTLLPKLKSATLKDLPQLKRVYEGILACDFLQKFEISRCSNLKQLPQIQPLFQEFKIQDCQYLK